jgi:hypothetical protein
MTPEERAKKCCATLSFFSKADKATGEKAVADAIRAALQTERHICANLAESCGSTVCQDFGMQDDMRRTADDIAKQIRARIAE